MTSLAMTASLNNADVTAAISGQISGKRVQRPGTGRNDARSLSALKKRRSSRASAPDRERKPVSPGRVPAPSLKSACSIAPTYHAGTKVSRRCQDRRAGGPKMPTGFTSDSSAGGCQLQNGDPYGQDTSVAGGPRSSQHIEKSGSVLLGEYQPVPRSFAQSHID